MKDEFFAPIHENMESILNSKKFIGRAPELVNEFLFDEVYPVLDRYKEKLDGKVEINV